MTPPGEPASPGGRPSRDGAGVSALTAIDLPPPWQEAAAAVLATAGVVLVVGGPDCGKSTFCRVVLAAARRQGLPLAFIDADLGQSHVGPPTTLGLKFFPPYPPDSLTHPADLLYFIGQTSPPGRLLEIVLGLQRLAAAARARCPLVLVNTSGLVSGPLAVRLKVAKAEALAPQLIIFLERGEELAAVASPLRRLAPRTCSLQVSSQARPKTWTERWQYRQERFAAYFAPASPLPVPLAARFWLGFPFAQAPVVAGPERQQLAAVAAAELLRVERGGGYAYLVTGAALSEEVQTRVGAHLAPDRLCWASWSQLAGRLVGLLDANLLTMALGVLLAVAWDREEAAILTPLPAARLPEVRFVRLGRLRLDRTGQELPPL